MAEFYAITGSAPTLTGLSETNLSAQPFPTEFQEYHDVIGSTGDGKPVAAGFPWTTWNYDNQILTAEQWDELMAFFPGNEGYADVYIRTRTNEVSAGKYLYRNYSAVMHRPKGNPKARYRFEDVSIEFTGLKKI